MVAKRIDRLKESPLREILKVIDKPGMISFAGGLPATQSFLEMDWSGIQTEQLQYGPSEGDWKLRQQVAESLTNRGLDTSPERVLILSGSQQGIDLVAKLMIDTSTRVAVEVPTYLAALQVFDLFGARYVPFTPDQPEVDDASLVYTNPTFQNPTGHCYSVSQRLALADACDNAGSVLFEDDPYRDLVYDDCDQTPVCSYIRSSAWIYQSSFSKTYAPGLRLGYLTCSAALFPYLVRLKQAADLHSCRTSQWLASELLQRSGCRSNELAEFYRERRDYFQSVLDDTFEDIATWKLPVGGLFFWLLLKEKYQCDTRELLQTALRHGVAFMPGELFYPDGVRAVSGVRLNFSHASSEQVRKGLQTLSKIFRSVGSSRDQTSIST